jgi:transcriptional regulator with GAF, ATPase, and Fis domain
MRSVLALLEKVALSPSATVLLCGESGTGKDLAAKAIHNASIRAAAPFMNITCSALPETLLESELFGHERGAFTDAKQRKVGLLELADGGTVFLDEIGEMKPALQAKLLRFLEERSFKRVGGSTDVHVDVRVIAATNRDLAEEVRRGDFRQDLYYRLMVIPVELPALRERRGDLPALVHHFIRTSNRERGPGRRPVVDIEAEALALLESHSWPGNVRELKNAIEHALLLTEADTLTVEDFHLAPPTSTRPGPPDAEPMVPHRFELPPEGINFEEVERDLVQQALERTRGNQTAAAALLGMNRDQIRYRIEKFNLRELRSSFKRRVKN